MNRLSWIIRISILAAILAVIATPQSKVGTTSAQFLKFGVGARSIGMGEAFVAVANDASALYWNPGGIAWATQSEVTLNHSDWLAGVSFDYAGVVVPLPGFGVIGFDLTSLDIGEMKVRTELEPEGTGEKFSSGAIAMGVAYAKNLTDRFSIGFKGKYIRESIWHSAASSYAIDVGTLFTTQFNEMKIGMSISNFGGKMRMEGRDLLRKYDPDLQSEGNNDKVNVNLETEKWSLPLIFRVGIALDVLKNSFNKTTVAVDALHPNDSDESLNIGMESVWSNLIALRVGWRNYGNDYMQSGPTYGAGLIVNTPAFHVTVDYCYADYGILENVKRYTISIAF